VRPRRPGLTRRSQPIIYSTLSMEGIEALVRRCYDLNEPLECTFFCRGVSDTYRISTPEQRFALKVYRARWRTREAIEWEMATLKHMDLRGVEVAMSVPRRNGQIITNVRAPEGLRSAVLFQWVRGYAPKYTEPEHARQFGRLLARVHEAGGDIPPDASRPQFDIRFLLEEPLSRIRSRLQSSASAAARLAALEDRILERIEQADGRLGSWGFCHGDIWANNARIDGGRLTLFDFDFAGFGWQLFDLASYRWHARYDGVEQAAWTPFIEGYQQVRPLEADSRELINLFMILKHLWTTAHFMALAPETGLSFVPDEQLEGLAPYCESIEAESGH